MTQPKIPVEQTQLDKAIEVLSLAAMGAYLVFVFLSYGKLPEEIPTHFGPTGEPDAWSSRISIFVLPMVALALYGLFTLLNKDPHTFNYPVKITPENAAFHYKKGRSLLTRIKAGIILLFFFITWRMVDIALGKATGLGPSFLFVLIGVIFIPIIIYFLDIRKAPKK